MTREAALAAGAEGLNDGASGGAPEIVADGVTAVSVRRGLAKIEFYRVDGPGPNGSGERRRAAFRVAVPVAGLQELSIALRRLSDAAARRQGEG